MDEYITKEAAIQAFEWGDADVFDDYGDYGAFIEFDEEQANLDEYIIAPGQEYRVNNPRYSKNVKYIWMTIPDGSNIKIYKQKKKVAYADYKSGMFYISPHECMILD